MVVKMCAAAVSFVVIMKLRESYKLSLGTGAAEMASDVD
jgi:hypothetical protein